MSALERRLAAIEDQIEREGMTLRGEHAPSTVAAELRDAGCTVLGVHGRTVVVDEGRDATPEVAVRREARLLSLAARGPAFADVLVIILSRLEPFDEEHPDFFHKVVVADPAEAVIYSDAVEVARGTVADLARGIGSVTPSLKSSTTTSSTTEDA